MESKILKLLLAIAHLSEKFKVVSDELDKIYEIMGDQAFIDLIKNDTQK